MFVQYSLSFFTMAHEKPIRKIEFEAANDQEAIQYAERQYRAAPKELWNGDRLIKRFFAKLGNFISYPMPDDEDRRLAILPSYDLLGTDPEHEFDQMARFAADLMDAPICLVSLIGKGEQWLKARWGLDVESTPRDLAFCTYTILSDEQLVVPDVSQDRRFHDNPLVTGDPHIRFYAGSPLTGEDGVRLGALCIIDTVPRFDFGDRQRTMLRDLAAIVSERFKLRRLQRDLVSVEREAFREAERGRTELAASNADLVVLRDKVTDVVVEIDRIAVGLKHLAINAAIEAAHAGPFGNGFGAVANEVKRLATETRFATTTARELLAA